MAFFAFLATFTTFSALILEVFTMIGNTYNKSFLNSLYLTRLSIENGSFIDFGLWGYCTGRDGVVEMCSQPKAGFVWSQVPELSSLIHVFQGQEKLFLAVFILYWIAIGLTLFAMIVTILSHWQRSNDVCASLACFISFIVMLVVLVILLVASSRGIQVVAKDASIAVTGALGPAMWMTVGAMVALFLSSITYCISCLCGSGRRVRDANKV